MKPLTSSHQQGEVQGHRRGHRGERRGRSRRPARPRRPRGIGQRHRRTDKKATTEDNAIDKTVEQREAAPGNVRSLHVGIVIDTRSLGASTPQDVQALVTSALGINAKRGDTVTVTTMPFDRTQEKAAAAALAAAKAADAKAATISMVKTGGIAGVIAGRAAARLVPRPQAPQAARPGHDVRRRAAAAAQRRRPSRCPPNPPAAELTARPRRSCGWPPATRSPRWSSASPRRSPSCCAAGSSSRTADDDHDPQRVPASARPPILLVQLGQEQAAQLLAMLPEAEVEAISAEILELEALEAARPRAVLTEFRDLAPRAPTCCAAAPSSPGPCCRSRSATSAPSRS